jgi:3-isopropylmalate/(R)-2-methylmalate dehydratase large subunit
VPGADSHSRAYGAYGAVGIGVGSTTLGFGWSTGYIYFTPARANKVRLIGQLQPWVSGKDIVLGILQRWGARQAQGMSIEFIDVNGQLPMAYRNTICNMMAEAEAQNGIFAPDEITYEWYKKKGMTDLPYPEIVPGRDASYDSLEVVELSEIVPMVARPYSPGNAVPASELAKERLVFDKAFIGSCTNGSYDDLLQAALVIKAARDAGHLHARTEFIVFPGSGGVKEAIENPDPRLDGRSIADVFREVGAKIRDSWCGPCFGQGRDALSWGQRAITSFNRNWQNRMGVGGQGYLASPAVVAASALVGYMAPPEALGIDWDPKKFGI